MGHLNLVWEKPHLWSGWTAYQSTTPVYAWYSVQYSSPTKKGWVCTTCLPAGHRKFSHTPVLLLCVCRCGACSWSRRRRRIKLWQKLSRLWQPSTKSSGSLWAGAGGLLPAVPSRNMTSTMLSQVSSFRFSSDWLWPVQQFNNSVIRLILSWDSFLPYSENIGVLVWYPVFLYGICVFFPNRFSPNTTLAYYLNLFTLHFSNFFGLIYELKPQLFNFKVLLMKCLFTHLYGVNNSHKRKHSK